ncbi:hypothetical protein TRIATDRAFT_298121 [Trichoderma atroviride IMI 206040]|uniref:Transcription factor domain-containing protein n=1 Tax=Hypocrea atroviridis (strain ATCC 20476 / IMI 206040) TaxID=452589 RepID=G9NLL4_HYPAI|nr:uncharacterized protein TRIATDRAFT_298121 [Trichoderma atroviride IMI 206040]EHK48776.1 hypothetical protein TRIATDRAFT_298121 [Trichoderma atroviride IMI 206040]
MRRRLWWQICTLDVRVAEVSSSEPFIIQPSLHTELPLNINDISLDPHIGELSPQPGRSEMLLSLVRIEISNFARRIVFSDQFCRINNYGMMNEAQKCQAIDEFKERIEKQYLSHCHEAIPLDCLIIMSSRLILAKLKLAVYKTRPNQHPEMPVRANYKKACEKFLEQACELRQYIRGRRWLWLFQYIEWDALAYLLLDLCITLSLPGLSSNEFITTPWKVVDGIYKYWKQQPDVHRDRGWVKIEKLYSKALSVKERAQNATQTFQATPSYCSQEAHDQPEEPSNGTEMQQQCESSLDSASAEEAQSSASTTELPGAGTACEWNASLIETYWEVAGHGNEGF